MLTMFRGVQVRRLNASLLFLLFIFTPNVNSDPKGHQTSLAYLQQVMDEYHNRFPVYDDAHAPGNHFHVWVKHPDPTAPITMDSLTQESRYSGTTAIRCEFPAQSLTPSGGFSFQNGYLPPTTTIPSSNFGEIPNAGYDLTGATALTFWARGEQGNEHITFFMGGTGRDPDTGMPIKPYPDSTPLITTTVTLTTTWQKYTIDVAEKNLNYVLSGFGWNAQALHNPEGAIFYLDAIQYELNPTRLAKRLNTARFLKSFAPVSERLTEKEAAEINEATPNDLAFSYDNAMAILAFLADGSVDSLRRAQLIGDAFVYVAHNEQSFAFQDEQKNVTGIRTVYLPGDLTLPPGWRLKGKPDRFAQGFFYQRTRQFIEATPRNIAVGNNGWTMIALLSLYKSTGQADYLETAKRIGEFIWSVRDTDGLFQGFQGGLHIPDNGLRIHRQWASTEHNLDVFSAFSTLYQITGESKWQEGAEHAHQFIEHMYDPRTGCFLAGTLNPNTRNTRPGQLPLDSQSWSILALPDSTKQIATLLKCAEQNHRTTADGFTGFDFNDDKDGVWFEGTAQMAVAYHHLNRPRMVDALLAELRRAQGMYAQRALNRQGLVAASHHGVTTGFHEPLLHHMHVGATAWNVFAETGFNPFYDTARILPGILVSLPDNQARALPTEKASSQPSPTMEHTPRVAFRNLPNHVQTNIAHILVSGKATPLSTVSINGKVYPTNTSGIYVTALPLTLGENSIEITIKSGASKADHFTKQIEFNPKLSTSDRSLIYVDSIAPHASGTIVLDHTNNVILGILLDKHIRGIAPDGQLLYTQDRSVIQTASHQETLSFLNPLNFSQDIPHNGFLVSPDGIHLYSRDEIFDLRTNQVLPGTLPINILTGVPFSRASIAGGPAISPDGQILYVGPSTKPGRTVSINLNNHAITRMLELGTESFQSDIAISPNNRFLLRAAYCCGNGVEILDTETSTVHGPVKIGDFSGEIAFSQDGKKVIVGSAGNPSMQGGGITVFDLHTLTINAQAVMQLADNVVVTPQNEVFVSSGNAAGIEVFYLSKDGTLSKTKKFFLGINQFTPTLGIPKHDEIRRIIVKP